MTISILTLSSTVTADELSDKQTELNKIQTEITKTQKKEDSKNLLDKVIDQFTGNEEAKTLKDLKATEKDLKSEIEQLKDNEETKNNSKTVEQLNTASQTAADDAKAKKEAEEKAKKEAEEKAKKEAEEKAKQEAEEKAKQETETTTSETSTTSASNSTASTTVTATDGIQFGSDGLLVMTQSSAAQSVVNQLLAIPGHSNGASYHANGLDSAINQLSTAEALWVLWRIEGAGFGQTAAGYAGADTPTSHQALVSQQINKRFGGSIHALLRAWGTYSYGGY